MEGQDRGVLAGRSRSSLNIGPVKRSAPSRWAGAGSPRAARAGTRRRPRAAAADGELWNLRVTSVPEPGATRAYIETDPLRGRDEGHRFAFAVLDAASGAVIGSSSYHDIVPAVERLEIGYTWYAAPAASAVNTTAKLLLMQHAFGPWARSWWAGAPTTQLREPARHRAPGRALDGVLRHHALRHGRHGARHRDVQPGRRRMAEVRRTCSGS